MVSCIGGVLYCLWGIKPENCCAALKSLWASYAVSAIDPPLSFIYVCLLPCLTQEAAYCFYCPMQWRVLLSLFACGSKVTMETNSLMIQSDKQDVLNLGTCNQPPLLSATDTSGPFFWRQTGPGSRVDWLEPDTVVRAVVWLPQVKHTGSVEQSSAAVRCRASSHGVLALCFYFTLIFNMNLVKSCGVLMRYILGSLTWLVTLFHVNVQFPYCM